MSENIINTMILFLAKTIPDMKSREFDMPYIKFVFDENYLETMTSYMINIKYYNNFEKCKDSLNYLKKIKDDYDKDLKNEEDIFIKVKDYKNFFKLLNNIVKTYELRKDKKILHGIDFIRSIWLRMSPCDINDVNIFLKKQLKFLKNDDVLNYNETFYKKDGGFDILYQNKSNEEWFETNNNITFLLRSTDLKENYYELPSIHYAFNKENSLPVCYIYGIQNIDVKKQDEMIKEKIKVIKKLLRNKYVSPDFILSLKIFIDFLADNNIKNIKVPLLQVFNYTYHKHLSDSIKDALEDYTEEEKINLEQSYNNGDISDKVLDYMHNKKMYNKFVNKEDMISKNKTERLINTFLVMQEKHDNIQFLNEPFIEGDYLEIRINNDLEKEKIKYFIKN